MVLALTVFVIATKDGRAVVAQIPLAKLTVGSVVSAFSENVDVSQAGRARTVMLTPALITVLAGATATRGSVNVARVGPGMIACRWTLAAKTAKDMALVMLVYVSVHSDGQAQHALTTFVLTIATIMALVWRVSVAVREDGPGMIAATIYVLTIAQDTVVVSRRAFAPVGNFGQGQLVMWTHVQNIAVDTGIVLKAHALVMRDGMERTVPLTLVPTIATTTVYVWQDSAIVMMAGLERIAHSTLVPTIASERVSASMASACALGVGWE